MRNSFFCSLRPRKARTKSAYPYRHKKFVMLRCRDKSKFMTKTLVMCSTNAWILLTPWFFYRSAEIEPAQPRPIRPPTRFPVLTGLRLTRRHRQTLSRGRRSSACRTGSRNPPASTAACASVGDMFQLEDGTPIKFWGTNLAYGGNCAGPKAAADFTAARFARYGVNAVRLHKFTYPGSHNGIGDAKDSTRMDPTGLDRLDYFSARLKAARRLFRLVAHLRLPSPSRRPRPARRLRRDRKAYPDGNTYAFINFAPDVQDLMIEMVVNLLKHKNPYTGLTYADEPALCFLEMQNEDDIFFYTSEKAFNACPTYRKQFLQAVQRLAEGDTARRRSCERRGDDALKPAKSLRTATSSPQVNPWFFSDDHLPKTRAASGSACSTTAAFLHEVQNEFYGRSTSRPSATPATRGRWSARPGRGPRCCRTTTTCAPTTWPATSTATTISAEHLEDSMLAQPGSGYFSTGLQQVIDRPFGLSEWITVYPSLYSAEGPAIVAAYGMGLQGWDASYEFQSQAGRRAFDDTAGGLPWGVWDADTPTQVGQYPVAGPDDLPRRREAGAG